MVRKVLIGCAWAIVAIAAAPGSVDAQNMDVPSVVAACGTPDEAWISFCNGYVQAVYDTAILSGVSICPPSGITRATMAEVVFRSLHTLQESAGRDAMTGVPGAAAVTVTLEQHYPC